MNIYARIRQIENDQEFKRLFNQLLSRHYEEDFETTRDHGDLQVDGYLKSKSRVYAVYCPNLPERIGDTDYKKKIKQDVEGLKSNIEKGKLGLEVREWCFVTPDELRTPTKDYIRELTEENGWSWATIDAYFLGALFLEHPELAIDFPMVGAGLAFDKTPSLYVQFAKNRRYRHLEIFNNGTEAVQDVVVETKLPGVEWCDRSEDFIYEFDDPARGYKHTCKTLRKGERQYIADVPTFGGFRYRVSCIGVESRKIFSIEGEVDNVEV